MLPDLYFDANGSTPLHPRVLDTCQGLLADLYGNPSAAHADGRRARRPEGVRVPGMPSNNETGVVQPGRGPAELCRERAVLFPTDAVAALGKLPVAVRAIGCDLMSLASHKLYAPKGCGVLYVRKG